MTPFVGPFVHPTSPGGNTSVSFFNPQPFPSVSIGGGTPPAAAGLRYYNVLDYGAKGLGVTDDTVGIQGASNAILAAGGGVLFFPPGTYKITLAITVPSNCIVMMVPGAKVVQYTEAQSVFFANNVSAIKFRDCVVDYNTTAVRQTQGAIHITNCTNFEVSVCRVIKSAGMGIYTANNVRGRILSNIIEATLADGIHITNGGQAGNFSKDISVVNNICNGTGDDSIAVIGYTAAGQLINESITITGNVVDSCVTRAITVAGGKFVTVSSNTIRDTAGSTGINCMLDETFVTFAAEEVVIIGNVIESATGASSSTRAGIRVYRSHRVTVIGNLVDWQAGEGIIVYGKTDNTDDALDNQVIGNVVRGAATGEQGIHGQRANNLLIKNNTIVNATKSGIYAEICDQVVIEGNVLDESNLQNVGATNLLSVVGGGVSAVVLNNVIKQTGTNFTHAIIFSAQAGECRHGNNVFNVTSAMAGVYVNNTGSNLNPIMSADRGDANATIIAGTDAESQRYATALTANRTVTLSTSTAGGGLHHGAKFRVIRTGLGAFTLDVGGLKTIPNTTAAFVDVEWDAASGAWRLAAYGTL